MSELILFRPRPGRTQQRGSPGLKEAEIMFFTGVRYERMVEASPTREEESIDPTPAEGTGSARPGRFAYALRRDTSPQREAPI
jgi:hypothetical protein